MIIDFHTHVFPDELAPRAMKTLTEEVDNAYPASSDGTVSGLLKNMDDWGIDISVVCPVVTKPSQVRKANEFSASIQSDRIVSFGGIYPNADNWKADIDYAAELGLRGLKFHCEYQNFILDDERMMKIYDYALNKGLMLIHHAGYDPAFPPPFKSSPEQFRRIVDTLGIDGKRRADGSMRGGIVIAAHLGGHDQWDDVAEYMAGTAIYLDTSMGFEYYSREQFLRIIEKHGADNILFASDAPWSNAKKEIEHLKSMPLSVRDIAAILGGNAARLLGL